MAWFYNKHIIIIREVILHKGGYRVAVIQMVIYRLGEDFAGNSLLHSALGFTQVSQFTRSYN